MEAASLVSAFQHEIKNLPKMDLRDYFAARALAGLCSNPGYDSDPIGYADDAYRFADAMLSHRSKERSE